MSDGALIKADRDFTKEVDKAIPEAEELAKVVLLCSDRIGIANTNQNDVQAAVEKLLALEKQTRQVWFSTCHPPDASINEHRHPIFLPHHEFSWL